MTETYKKRAPAHCVDGIEKERERYGKRERERMRGMERSCMVMYVVLLYLEQWLNARRRCNVRYEGRQERESWQIEEECKLMEIFQCNYRHQIKKQLIDNQSVWPLQVRHNVISNTGNRIDKI